VNPLHRFLRERALHRREAERIRRSSGREERHEHCGDASSDAQQVVEILLEGLVRPEEGGGQSERRDEHISGS
jgi:hypothetical protein